MAQVLCGPLCSGEKVLFPGLTPTLYSVPVLTDEQKSRIQAMKPMTKEEWDARQSVIRKVVDPETGRTRCGAAGTVASPALSTVGRMCSWGWDAVATSVTNMRKMVIYRGISQLLFPVPLE